MVMQNLCYVCGYEMDEPPSEYNICPSCGTEFGVNDANASVEELREAWIETGPKWWSDTDPKPPNWNPFEQLARITASRSVVASKSIFHIETASSFDLPLTSGWVDWSQVLVWSQPEGRQLSLAYK